MQGAGGVVGGEGIYMYIHGAGIKVKRRECTMKEWNQK